MARPTSRLQLLDLDDSMYVKLVAFVDSLSPEQLAGQFPFDDRDRGVRDVLAHLYEWQLMMLRWYREGMTGQKPAIPAEGYTWRTLPELNQRIWEQYQGEDLQAIRDKLAGTHGELREIIESHSDDELFEKRRYPWTGTTSLGAYVISSTTSHYDWALKKLRRYRTAIG